MKRSVLALTPSVFTGEPSICTSVDVSQQFGTMGSSTLGKAASIDSLLNEYIHAFGERLVFKVKITIFI